MLVAMAFGVAAADDARLRYAELSPADPAALADLLARIEALSANGLPNFEPIVIVVHGPEAPPVFLRRNYSLHKPLVDLAARLDGLGLADFRMCETWMRENGVGRDDLAPFVDTVRFAPEEVRRLEASGYVRF